MRQIVLLLALVLVLAACVSPTVSVTEPTPIVPPSPSQTVIPTPHALTKTSGCVVRGALPDPDCTPGAIIGTATVAQICVPGYSKAIRNVSTAEKDQVFAEYGIASHVTGQFEVDHLISLELGGSNDLANLWPEAANPRPGFHEKDQIENRLHAEVCAGTLTLADAQHGIATNWLQYELMPTPTPLSVSVEGMP